MVVKLLEKAPALLGCLNIEEPSAFFYTPSHVVFESGKPLNRWVPINLYGGQGHGPKRAQRKLKF